MKKIVKKAITVLLVISLLVPTFAMIATAATGDPVELAFNNIFVFEKWASNKLSTTPCGDGVPNSGGTLTTDIQNGSFTMTKTNMSAVELYNGFSFNAEDATQNLQYYMADVEPNTNYKFCYTLSGTVTKFNAFVFYFDESGKYISLQSADASNFSGENILDLKTPSNARSIQVRFNILDTSANTDAASVTATVSNIWIYKFETIYSNENLFVFDEWAGNAKSSAIDATYGYNDGYITPNADTDSIHFETNTDSSTSNMLFTGFNLSSNSGYYNIDVEPNTTYTLLYDIGDYDAATNNALNFEPWIVYNKEDGSFIKYTNYVTPGYGANAYTFTTDANTSYISVVFAIEFHSNPGVKWYITVQDIALYQTEIIEHKATAHRKVYSEGSGTYGTLPTPTYVPDGRVFAGWYTGLNGTGELITADTEIGYTSCTVYPKYEVAVDSLSIATMPTKTEYTLGEKFNPTGLVLTAVAGDSTFNISSGYVCSPEYLNTAGTQTISVTYGGKTVTFDVTVNASNDTSVIVNDASVPATVANNVYTLNYDGDDFNRYEMTYYSDSYVRGTLTTTATDGTKVSEEFFLEPSTNGSFASYIDGFLDATVYPDIVSIGFECLNKEFGNFELYSVKTILVDVPTDNMQYQQDDIHKVGIDLSKGGSLTYIEELSGTVVAVDNGEGVAAEINYADLITTGGTQTTEGVNLINRHDPGRYVQQSYYGTSEDPYVTGDYNGVTWNYNPVQGGNYKHESSKIIDYRITTNEIYVKARPLDWGKYSDEFANSKEGDYSDNNFSGAYEEGIDTLFEPVYGDEYITDSYMETWYVFEGDCIKTYCRFVDYSGYPSATTTQELPAFYCVEPLNTFAYYEGETIWEEETLYDYAKATTKNEPDFWGATPSYNAMLEANGLDPVNSFVESGENWAAFMADDNPESFGIGIYSAGVTSFKYGTYPSIYKFPETDANGNNVSNTLVRQFDNADMYELGVHTTADYEDDTSYIAPVDTMTFESYSPYTYSYYIASGTFYDIREDFRRAVIQDEAEAAEGADIAVPETAYMTPAASGTNSKIGQYYVNNILNQTNGYAITTVAERDDAMQFSVHIDGATEFTVDITNMTNSADDIDLYDASGNEVSNTYRFDLGDTNGLGEFDSGYTLRFNTTGLAANEKATAKWAITGYDSSGNVVGTYYAYTVLYAPGPTIGAVAESRRSSTYNNEISSWITGANGVDHSQLAPFGSYGGDKHASGQFISDPLVNADPPTGGSSETANDYITTTTDYSDSAYVMQTATDGADGSRALSYLGLLKVDKSRYTNTNQIPNLQIGHDVLRVNDNKKDSLTHYDTYYTLGTSDSFVPSSYSDSPSGWTQEAYTEFADTGLGVPYRKVTIPSYSVSDIDGKYIHAVNTGRCYFTLSYNYATAGASVLCSVTDKSALRDSVTEGYTLPEEKYSEDSYNKFQDALEEAATVLGDPSADQITIDNAQKNLDDAKDALVNIYYALKYDNLFSAYEFSQHTGNMTMSQPNESTVSYADGTLTTVNSQLATGKTETYTKYGTSDEYYRVALTPNTEYVFEYDVTTDLKAQAFMFFYNASGGNGDVPQNIQLKTNDGAWVSKSESNSWWGNYNGAGTYHYAIKFTTGANTTSAGFRFGNTDNAAVTSTFSNIRLVDAAHYYEDATYSKTEAVYKEYESYGTLITPVRTGYTFAGWVDAEGNAVTGATIATEHLSIYSKWSTNSYTITYNANGGSVSPASDSYTIEKSVNLPTPTRDGYTFKGWKATAAEGNWTLGQNYQTSVSGMYGNVTLTAQWTLYEFPVLFDTILDIDKWSTTANNATISERTENGFTLTSNAGVGEGTTESPEFPVTAGKSYYIDIDFEGDNWDVYIFFRSETVGGTGIGFADSTNRFSSNGSGATSRTFTAPAGATKAVIRLDANGANNSVKFSDIRVYEAGTCASDVNVPDTSMTVEYGETFGALPVPTRDNYDFLGWYDASGKQVVAGDEVTYPQTTTLYSKWKERPVTQDTVVIDYGLPVKINVLANDKDGGKINAIGTGVASGTDINYTAYTESKLVDSATKDLKLTYGTAYIDGDAIVYTPASTSMDKEEVFYYEYKTGSSYYYTTVTVIPAANIYYEESFMNFIDGDGYKWEDAGTTYTDKSQSEDRPGESSNVYGSDSAYDDSYTYSLNSAKVTSVDCYSFSKEPTATFSFCGTGFELFSVTNNDTGAILVTIYYAGTKTICKNYLVSTYYGYTVDSEGTLIPDTESNDGIYQVPVISKRDLDYGSYDVVIKPLYSSAFDPNYTDDGGAANAYKVYVDSVRIFNPAGVEGNVSDAVGDAYFADNEFAPTYMEVRDTLLASKDISSDTVTNMGLGYKGTVFLDAASDGALADYESKGPKNEVYLGKGQAIAFHVASTDGLTLASLQLGMKVASGGETAQVYIMNSSSTAPVETIKISGAHESFKKIDSAIVWDETELENGVYKTEYPIVIVNASDTDTVVSLTAFKWAHTTDASAESISFMVYEDTPMLATMSLRNAIAYQERPYTDEDITMEWSDTSFTEGKEATLTITTPDDVAKVTVGGVEVTEYEIDENGNKVWTYTFIVKEAGENTYDIILCRENGVSSDPIQTETIVVEEAEPAEGDTDNSEATFLDKLANIFAQILEYIKTIITFLWRVIA